MYIYLNVFIFFHKFQFFWLWSLYFLFSFFFFNTSPKTRGLGTHSECLINTHLYSVHCSVNRELLENMYVTRVYLCVMMLISQNLLPAQWWHWLFLSMGQTMHKPECVSVHFTRFYCNLGRFCFNFSHYTLTKKYFHFMCIPLTSLLSLSL